MIGDIEERFMLALQKSIESRHQPDVRALALALNFVGKLRLLICDFPTFFNEFQLDKFTARSGLHYEDIRALLLHSSRMHVTYLQVPEGVEVQIRWLEKELAEPPIAELNITFYAHGSAGSYFESRRIPLGSSSA